MIINKVKPFYTAELNAALAENSAQLNAVLETLKTGREGSPELTRDSSAQGRERLAELKRLYDIQNGIHAAAEQAYIDHFFGDVDAILSDVREIVNAIDKEEYISWQKKTTDDCKKLLAAVELQKEDKQTKENIKELKQLATRGYQNCYFFILERIRVQLNALDFYKSEGGTRQAIAIVETKTNSYYSKPKGAKLENKQLDLIQRYEPVAAVRGGLLPIPNGPLIDFTYEVLSGDLDTLPERRKRYNRNVKMTIDKDENKRTLTYTSKSAKATITIDDFTKLVNKNTKTKKILTRILIHANNQAVNHKGIIRTRVSFPLSELLGEEQYSSLDAARVGFYKAGDILTSLKISGNVKKGKTLQQGSHAVLFTNIKVSKSTCEVYLNDTIAWNAIVPFYTVIPDFYFELPNRSAELLDLIFHMARRKTKVIRDSGYFWITYRNIQYHLNLPDETKTKNPKRDIKDEIEKAIEQIEEKYSNYARPLQLGEDPDLSLLPLADPDAPIKQYLDEGRLKVSLKGEYANMFLKIAQKTTEEKEKQDRKQEKIEIQAQANRRTKKKT